jgi:hypothetical protein
MIYGLSAYDEYMEDGLYDIESVVCHIVQPRKHSFTKATYTIAELNTFRYVVNGVVEMIAAKSTLFKPSEKGCQWCPASGICKAQATAHLATLTKEFDDMDKKPVDVQLLGIAELSEILSKKKEMENWLKSVESVCFGRLERGLEVPGHKMVAGRTLRKWANEDEAVKFLKRRMPFDQVYTQKLLSPPQAEKLIELGPRSVKAWEALITKPEGKPTIVKESDKRPALLLSDDFDNLDEL